MNMPDLKEARKRTKEKVNIPKGTEVEIESIEGVKVYVTPTMQLLK